MKVSLYILGVVFSGLMFQPSFADEPLNVVGTWKGVSSAVHVGSSGHFIHKNAGVNWGEDTEFTWKFTEQRGNDFTGELMTKNRTEHFVGSISPNNKDIIVVDEDGTYNMTVRDPNTIDLCYSHVNVGSRITSCWVLERVK